MVDCSLEKQEQAEHWYWYWKRWSAEGELICLKRFILRHSVEWNGPTVEVPTCDTGFLHEKWPPFWGSSKLIFFENVSCNRPSWYKTYQLSGSHSVEALSPKKSICAQKAINFSIPTKIVVAARQSVKSQLHVGKQPTKSQAVKIGQPRTWPYQTPKRDVRATTWKKRQQKRRQLNLRISFKKNLKGYLAKKMSRQDNN